MAPAIASSELNSLWQVLVEMFRSGVDIVGRDALTRAIRDEVVASILPKRGHRQRGSSRMRKKRGCYDEDIHPGTD
jgi:hypothetical protein